MTLRSFYYFSYCIETGANGGKIDTYYNDNDGEVYDDGKYGIYYLINYEINNHLFHNQERDENCNSQFLLNFPLRSK